MIKKAVLILSLFILVSGMSLYAQGEDLILKIAVVGPGNQLYFWWGHIALIIDDSRTGRSNFFDYGIFDFKQENFFLNFALGRLLYICGVSPATANMIIYERTNRDVIIYTLDLPAQTKLKVREFALINVLPENREYFYHHFDDNCSTRIRDIIDLATDGQFYEYYGQMESRFTLREHVRRHTWFSPPADWFLNFLMGQAIDRKITVWEDMFLPSEVGKWIEDFYYIDADGERRKLVSDTDVLFVSQGRPGVLEEPKARWPLFLIFSLVLTLVFGFFFYLYSKKIKAGRVLAGISVSLCGLFFGFAGLLLYFMSLFTNHDYTFENFNMIFCTPLLLVSFPAGLIYAFTNNQKKLFICNQLIRLVWLLTAAGIFVSMAIKILPWFYQDNLAEQLLLLPIALLFTCQPLGLKEVLDKYFPKKGNQHGSQ